MEDLEDVTSCYMMVSVAGKELKEIFPPLDRARWERERREQAKRLEEGERKRLERQRAIGNE